MLNTQWKTLAFEPDWFWFVQLSGTPQSNRSVSVISVSPAYNVSQRIDKFSPKILSFPLYLKCLDQHQISNLRRFWSVYNKSEVNGLLLAKGLLFLSSQAGRGSQTFVAISLAITSCVPRSVRFCTPQIPFLSPSFVISRFFPMRLATDIWCSLSNAFNNRMTLADLLHMNTWTILKPFFSKIKTLIPEAWKALVLE